MAVQELRQHLRIQSESKAVVILDDGSRIKCVVRDVSLGGAYLMQVAEYGAPEVLEAGQRIQVWLFHPGRAHEGPTVDAVVVRAEEGGPGLALRFELKENAEELVEHVAFEAQAQGVKRGQLGMPALSLPKQSVWRRVRTLGGPLVNVAIWLLVIGAFKIAKSFLNAVM